MTCLRFVHPSTFIVAGPTGSGKTQLVKSILTAQMFTQKIDKIYWCYSEWQKAYAELATNPPAEIEFIKGLPTDLYESINPDKRNLLAIDDLMSEAAGKQMIADLFTKGSHHRNLSILLFTQNLFHQGKEMRTISLNAHYIIIFKNPRANDQICAFAKQICPKNTRFIRDAFDDATAIPHGYLLFDFRPEIPDELRVRTNVLPKGGGSIIYVPRNDNGVSSSSNTNTITNADRRVYKPT